MLNQLVDQIRSKRSVLCVGLDTDLSKIPSFLLEYDDPIFEFNRRVIDATHDVVVAYKPNFAFYEAMGSMGWDSLKKTSEYIPKGILKIADAKRGDIGNTASYYAKAVFDDLGFDAITVSPYMGRDSITPFLAYKNKWTIVLGLTSNEGNKDLQQLVLAQNKPVYEQVMQSTAQLASENQLMFVVGATNGQAFKKIRTIIPHHFLLVPGVGAQGGDLETVLKYGLNDQYGLLINASRSILYASSDQNFEKASRAEALQMVEVMRKYI